MKDTKEVKKMWQELGDIPVDKDDNIDTEWKHFPIGTSKFDIWHWLEDTYDISVAKDLMKLA